jgi:CheY-like chemotaxis protein
MARVLVIDDHTDGRESLGLLLSLLGHRVDLAAGGDEGVRLALASRPDVALVDINMPGVDGYEVARRLRRVLKRGITLIAHTAIGPAPPERSVREAGFDAWLVKPVDPEELLSRIAANGSGPS